MQKQKDYKIVQYLTYTEFPMKSIVKTEEKITAEPYIFLLI